MSRGFRFTVAGFVHLAVVLGGFALSVHFGRGQCDQPPPLDCEAGARFAAGMEILLSIPLWFVLGAAAVCVIGKAANPGVTAFDVLVEVLLAWLLLAVLGVLFVSVGALIGSPVGAAVLGSIYVALVFVTIPLMASRARPPRSGAGQCSV